MKVSLIIHDTFIVLRADAEAFRLFRATSEQLVGSKLIDLIHAPELKGLALLRMQIARMREPDSLPDIDYLFRRFDGSMFYGRVNTRRLETPGEWESTIEWLYEYS